MKLIILKFTLTLRSCSPKNESSVITLVILITGTFKPFGIAYDTVPLKCNDSVNSKTFYS